MKTTENYISGEYFTVFLIKNDQIHTKFCQKIRKLKKHIQNEYFTAFFLQKLNEFGSKLIQKLLKNILRGKFIHVVNVSIVETSWYFAKLMNYGLWIFWDFLRRFFNLIWSQIGNFWVVSISGIRIYFCFLGFTLVP